MKETGGEPDLERHCALNLLDVLLGQPDLQGFNVALEMVEGPPTHNGEDIRSLVHDIGQSHTCDGCVLPVGNGLKDLGDLYLVLSGLKLAAYMSLPLLLCFEGASTKRSPRGETHLDGCQQMAKSNIYIYIYKGCSISAYPFLAGHGNDLTLEITVASTPAALVDAELTETMVAGVLVGLRNDPGRRVRDAQVQDLSLSDEGVETLHELRDGAGEVPPVDIEKIDVVGLQLLQACVHRGVEALGAIASEVGHLETVSQAQALRDSTRLVSLHLQ